MPSPQIGVAATNSNGRLFSGGERSRWFDIADFVTQPIVEQALTKNRTRTDTGPTADDLSEDHRLILKELKTMFPQNRRFTNARRDIKTLSPGTGIHMIAPVPICVIGNFWKEL